MKTLTTVLLKFLSQTYFVLASLYCFFAFIPFTYLFVVVNPPYSWLITFAHYNVLLLWVAIAMSIAADWPRRSDIVQQLVTLAEGVFGLVVSINNPVSHIHNDGAALVWSVALLSPILVTSVHDLLRRESTPPDQGAYSSIAYSDGVIVGLLTGLISIAALRLNTTIFFAPLPVGRYDAEIMFWAVVEHVTLAIAVLAAINLAKSMLSIFTKNPFILGPGIVASLSFVLLAFGCGSFIEESLSFHGWVVWGYSGLLSATVILCGLSLLLPMLAAKKTGQRIHWQRTFALLLISSVFYVLVTIDPRDDWKGIIHKLLAVLLWIVVAITVWRVRSVRKHYSIGMTLAVVLVTCAVYETLNRSKSVWAADLGASTMQISQEVDNYADRNASFRLVDTLLGNQEGAFCDSACKTLRQYSNVRPPTITRELKLVDHLAPSSDPKPNIFIIVIDSLRPDYLGIYNPRVDFTPHFDAFARDSVVMKRAYTNYAGTSLSEPSIWSGALLLHAHYAQPFDKINSLEKLARTDGYQIVISYDVILQSIMPDSRDLVKLDTDKTVWQQMELSDTVRQLEDFLDHRSPQASPVFFYTQAMNVHAHADNKLPKRTSQNWQRREGFDDRIAYTLHQTDDFFGAFLAYLKTKNLYDDSIIIVTSDHGDATGEFGRVSHSHIIYPEVMHVPMIVHLPEAMRKNYVYDENRIAALVDIAPSLYYLLGHRPIEANPLFGRPMFLRTAEEVADYPRGDLLLASDCCAVFGILANDGRRMYTTYDSPSRSMLFDLAQDPDAQHNILTPSLKQQYDDEIFRSLWRISKFYGHRPTGG